MLQTEDHFGRLPDCTGAGAVRFHQPPAGGGRAPPRGLAGRVHRVHRDTDSLHHLLSAAALHRCTVGRLFLSKHSAQARDCLVGNIPERQFRGKHLVLFLKACSCSILLLASYTTGSSSPFAPAKRV
ncbi:hypothetical protein EYF80_026238 [Liparis tanakae]|uniref:Uncharacterized protein n=1 Tax=Liparis tanakae TaxID=230148 RepID=A0A4Z2HCU8_9TELE|nr:hypothetical protein EYF80_026238 [Liparis tanakae]